MNLSTAPSTAPTAAHLDAARLLLARLDVSPADLLNVVPDRSPVPTFAEYIPVVRAAVSSGTRRVYGSYWNRIAEQWGARGLDEPIPSEINQLAERLKAVTMRRNARRGRGAIENLIAALRCLYRHAEDQTDNPPDESRNVGVVKHCRNTASRLANEHGAVGSGGIDVSLSQGR